MTDHNPMEERLTLLEGHQQISRLIAEYCHGADKRQLDRFLAVWHEDAVWDVGTAQFQGLAEIAEAIQRQWANLPTMTHWTSNLSIDLPLQAERAYAESDTHAITQTHTGHWYQSLGTYQDTYGFRDDRWGLTKRVAQVHSTHPLRAPNGLIAPTVSDDL